MFHNATFFSSDDSTWHSAADPVAFWRDLVRAGVEIVLNAQQYYYERFEPLDIGGSPDQAHGTREFIVGTGGDAVTLPKSIAPSSDVISATFGVLKLTLGDGAYLWQFIPVAGAGFTDAGSGTCH
jgi:hypothetical protein